MSQLEPIIKQSFTQYSAAVIQSRALVDARDGLKPSARQIFYSMHKNKLTHDKPYKKTPNAIGLALVDFYIHGDASCEGIIMRAGQPFAMRYPLVDVEGNVGTLLESGNWAAARYTSARLSDISSYLFNDIEKDTIEDWRDNYSDTQQYPAILPSKGFYNLVNGTSGIATGMASSIPQFNLCEVNSALVKLLWNPDIDFEEIYCAPDFATGAILLNANEVKESLRKGTGKSCKLRSVVEFDDKERCFVVKEIPYSVYTNTICGELEKILNSEDTHGIDRFNDLTGKEPLIKIYLDKRANVEKTLKFLYKETSLQYYYGINMTMLENGRFPKVFTWKEALQAYLTHQIQVYTRGFQYDLKKIENRLHIVDGLLIALARIEEVIQAIKSSSSTGAASLKLQQDFLLDEIQAKAILDMKLSRLAHLEVQKLEKEKNELENEAKHIHAILEDEILLKKEIENGLNEVSKKFGDSRRTQLMNLHTGADDEIIEDKALIVSLTNYGNIYTTEQSTLMTQRRGGTGNKMKLQNGECVIESFSDSNHGVMMAFSNIGKGYNYLLSDLPMNGFVNVSEILKLSENEKITNIISYNKADKYKYIIFITTNGLVKKTELSEYKNKNGRGAQAIKLRDGDSLKKIIFLNDEKIAISTESGQFLMFETKDINAIGKAAMGVQGVKLGVNDFVSDAQVVDSNAKEFITITSDGMITRTPIDEISITNRNVKGIRIQKINPGEKLVGFLTAAAETEIIAATKLTAIRFSTKEVQLTSRGSTGVKAIKLKPNEKVQEILNV